MVWIAKSRRDQDGLREPDRRASERKDHDHYPDGHQGDAGASDALIPADQKQQRDRRDPFSPPTPDRASTSSLITNRCSRSGRGRCIDSLSVFRASPGIGWPTRRRSRKDLASTFDHRVGDTQPEDTQQEENMTTSHRATSLHGDRIRRLTSIWIATLALLALTAAPALAHSQTVQPPSKESPVVSGPISNAWAQAHCSAQSPAVVADASGGVVTFSPLGPLPCPALPNPGGQVHPHAGT